MNAVTTTVAHVPSHDKNNYSLLGCTGSNTLYVFPKDFTVREFYKLLDRDELSADAPIVCYVRAVQRRSTDAQGESEKWSGAFVPVPSDEVDKNGTYSTLLLSRPHATLGDFVLHVLAGFADRCSPNMTIGDAFSRGIIALHTIKVHRSRRKPGKLVFESLRPERYPLAELASNFRCAEKCAIVNGDAFQDDVKKLMVQEVAQSEEERVMSQLQL